MEVTGCGRDHRRRRRCDSSRRRRYSPRTRRRRRRCSRPLPLATPPPPWQRSSMRHPQRRSRRDRVGRRRRRRGGLSEHAGCITEEGTKGTYFCMAPIRLAQGREDLVTLMPNYVILPRTGARRIDLCTPLRIPISVNPSWIQDSVLFLGTHAREPTPGGTRLRPTTRTPPHAHPTTHTHSHRSYLRARHRCRRAGGGGTKRRGGTWAR